MKISLITVTYNAERFLKECIASVAAQTAQAEYIIIDGASTDNTINIIKENISLVSHFLSEKDAGMYDALNKGIGMASGEIVGILNADDVLASPNILADISDAFSTGDADVLYGDLWYVDQHDSEKVVRRWKSQPYRRGLFQWGWMPAHPTFYARRELFEQYGDYRLDMGSAADYELMIRFLHQYQLKSLYLPTVMVKMRTGGLSNSSLSNRIKANQADMKAMKINGIRYPKIAALLKPLRKIPQFLGF